MNFEKSIENWLRGQSYQGHGGWICCHPLHFCTHSCHPGMAM